MNPLLRRCLPAIVGLLLLLLAPALANAQVAGLDSVRLGWTAPGDDGSIGTASVYQMRLSTSPITTTSWNAAVVIAGVPAPLPAGTRQTLTVRGLSRDTTYYFAIRTADDAANWSGLSNVVRWDWMLDTAPPAAPTGVLAARENANVRVTWTANSEPDLDGYSVYRAESASGTYTKLNAALVLATQFLDSSLPNGATSLWYKVSATDFAGNEGALSFAARVDLTSAATTAAWSLSPPYPNPSTTAQSVCIPVAVPAAGPGDAVLDILDAAGRRVRHIPLSGAATCAGGGVAWDGRNDAGSPVAPGVYRARLTAGDVRNVVRLVRQP
jgi:hypothetical protein